MKDRFIVVAAYELWDVLEHIKCEDIDDAVKAIRDYYINESFPFIYLRHVVDILDNNGIDYSIDGDELYDDDCPINILPRPY